MADLDFIGIDISGLDEVKRKLSALPEEASDEGVELVNEYMVNVERENARLPYAEEKFVWSSDRQRKAYFASNGFGAGIPYQRTQTLSQGWKTLGYGRNQIIVNEVPYAGWVKDEPTQIIGHKFRDWKTIQTDVQERMDQIVRRFEAGVRNAIHKLGLD